jgi:protein involved in polysaccharide export with SLBB domain
MKVLWALPLLLLLAPTAGWSQATTSRIVTLQPGDIVRVEIWREPDLSGSFTVDEGGVITFPLLGDRKVTDLPLDSLRAILTDEYRVHLRNPSIRILPMRKLLVLGAVTTPGPYEVNPIETVIGVIAQAGGISPVGNPKRVSVVRNGMVVQERVPLESTIGSLNVRSGDQIMVGQRSWLSRNQSLVVSVLFALPTAIFTITRIVE